MRPGRGVSARVDMSSRLGSRWTSLSPVRRCRVALAVVVLVATAGKLVLAARTFGTEDVARWRAYAHGVAHAGPVDVYRLHFQAASLVPHHHHHHHHYWLYNHPPLVGYMLSVINAATQRGVSFPLAIRIPAIAADVVTSFLVLELLRTRRSLLEALAAATLVALSPILLVISGYHGNTDPIFIMFSLLSVYLLVDQRAAGLAGLSIAIALSVKIVPVIIVPTLLVFAIRAGRRIAWRFVLSMGAFIALTWVPVVTQVWQPFRHDVLAYGGAARPSWGLAKLASIIGHPSWVTNHGTTGRYIIVAIVTAVPAALVLWRPWLVVEASALALVGLLLLSPAFAMQYLVWAAVPAYLLSFAGATAFNLFGGFLLIEIYNRASGGFPWYRINRRLNDITSAEQVALLAVWMTLVVVMIAGIGRIMRTRRPPTMVRAQNRPPAGASTGRVRETRPGSYRARPDP